MRMLAFRSRFSPVCIPVGFGRQPENISEVNNMLNVVLTCLRFTRGAKLWLGFFFSLQYQKQQHLICAVCVDVRHLWGDTRITPITRVTWWRSNFHLWPAVLNVHLISMFASVFCCIHSLFWLLLTFTHYLHLSVCLSPASVSPQGWGGWWLLLL